MNNPVGDKNLRLSAEKVQEAERKFWEICDYVHLQLHQDETVHGWYACMTAKKDGNKGKVNVCLAYKSKYPNLDKDTLKEFPVTNEDIGQEVIQRLRDYGFETCDDCEADRVAKVYVFRKERRQNK